VLRLSQTGRRTHGRKRRRQSRPAGRAGALRVLPAAHWQTRGKAQDASEQEQEAKQSRMGQMTTPSASAALLCSMAARMAFRSSPPILDSWLTRVFWCLSP
jgi:hypothetical protein